MISAARLSLVLALISVSLSAQEKYHIYAGSTHAHTAYTWSHGAQFTTNGCSGIRVYGPDASHPGVSFWAEGYVKSKNGCFGMYVINGFQYPSPDVTLKPDWEKYQGPPSRHFELAKANGYDFYVTSDHSQEGAFQPIGPDNPAWLESKRQARDATTADFAALPGFEYSENDGPGGVGHINVINSREMLNALQPGIDLPYFYKWLAAAQPNGEGPVVASFNHPDATQYGNWADRDAKVTDIITMLEVINSNNKIHYPAFVNALDKGWKVSPVCGNDNHGTDGISRNTSRTFVLATSKSKAAILDAMKNRRTYASLDRNIQCRYSVNGAIMGSTLNRPTSFHFDISVANAGEPITKIEILKDGGVVADSYSPAPAAAIKWTPTIDDSTSKYFFVRVSGAANPVAWLAPVWTGR
ncbi:MAG TPA: CehA/McbA family metallohydrolase [Bryobacteraceae bacterium]|nr:CehA/McbA family metallohydrolase [Bryobacteraceae bacterium]